LLEFSDVDYRYPNSGENVLQRLSLQIPDQGVTAIMGANGSGKSTAALCMNALLLPTGGVVRVNGMSTAEPRNVASVRKSVGVVFQNPDSQFTSLTVERELAFGLENIGMGQQEMKERVDECLRMFGLERDRKIAPSLLSGGEKQRVALAAVMIMNPDYLILDEATSLLAPLARKTILDHVTMLARTSGRAVVLITQFPLEAMLADHLLILCHGQVELEGQPSMLFRDGTRLRQLGVPIPLSTRLGFDGS